MAKLFKNSKSVLSFVLAFAVLAVSLFTGVVINSEAAGCDPDGSIVIYGGGAGVAPELLDPSAANSESNPYVIATPENLLYIVKEGVTDTAGKYYKVADGVSAFIMQPQDRLNAKGATVEDLMNLDASGVMDWFDDPNKTVNINSSNAYGGVSVNYTIEGTSVKWQNWNKVVDGNKPFAGTFDGNGVNIYGLLSQQDSIGLFGRLDKATIKNVNIKASYGFGYEGGAFGSHGWVSNANMAESVVTIENCTVTNSCFVACRAAGRTSATAASSDAYKNVGVLCGAMMSTGLNVNNCFVADNIAYHAIFDRGDGKTEADLIGTTVTDTYDYAANGNTLSIFGMFPNAATSTVSQTIALGITPYGSPKHNWDNNGGRPQSFSNVYTDKQTKNIVFADNNKISYDESQIKQIDPANMIGEGAIATCPALDWANKWLAVKNGMPVLRAFHNISLVGHTEKCADCGIEGAVSTAHQYEGNTCTICGHVLTCGEDVIYWNGTATAPTSTASGTKDDPIIIKNAQELNYIATQIAGTANGKWYKMADGIGTIILQPEGIVDADYLMGLTDAADVKDYLTGLSGVKDWIPDNVEKYFNGNFDGNGVQIYGLYTEGKNNAGLFRCVDPWFATDGNAVFTENSKNYYVDTNFDEPIVFKNFAIKNSYYSSARRMGAVVAMTGSPNYGTNYTGAITIDNCVVSNCFMETTSTNVGQDGERGLIVGALSSDLFRINNCLIYGNKATWSTGVEMSLAPQAGTFKSIAEAKNGNGFTWAADSSVIENTITNCVVLGTAPYCTRQGANDNRSVGKDVFENVYTDVDISNVMSGANPVNYEDNDMKNISGLTGAELAAACENLDWDNIWLATTATPELRVFHDETFTTADNGDGTHTVTCSCGLEVANGAHTWADGECTVCGAVCAHTNTHFVVKTPANCTEDAIADKVCDICGKTTASNIVQPGTALGHNLALVTGTPAKCTEDGVKDYYACSRCDAVFEDADGNIPISDLDSWKVIPAAGHTETKDSQNKTVYAWDSTQPGMHFKVCSVCHEKYDGENCTGEYVADGANGHSGRCTVCGIETAGVAPHNFDENGSCTTCHWTCTAHNFVDAGPGTPATCVTAGAVPTKCSICGKVGTDRVVDATGHNLEAFEACEGTCSWEGYIAHKYCYKCEKNFAADETDIYSTDYLTEEDISTPIVPENHNWVEVEAKVADHDNGGNVAYKYCDICGMLSMGDKEVDLGIDVEAIMNSIQDEVDAAWDEHEATRDEYDSDEEFNEAWDEKYDAIFHAAFNKAVLAAASANGVTLVTPAKGHTIVKVDEVPATTEKEGTKAHWICTDCGKLYSDAEGTTEVTLEQLVIAKLPATPAESTNTNTDNSNKAPATGETVATAVAAVAAVIAAGFVLVRKSRNA